MPFPHDEVQILILFTGNETIMHDTFLVVGHGSPAITVQSLEECKTRPVKPCIWVQRGAWEWVHVDSDCRRIRGDVSKGKMRNRRMVIGQVGWGSNNGRKNQCFCRRVLVAVECAILVEGWVAPGSSWKKFSMNTARGFQAIAFHNCGQVLCGV